MDICVYIEGIPVTINHLLNYTLEVGVLSKSFSFESSSRPCSCVLFRYVKKKTNFK